MEMKILARQLGMSHQMANRYKLKGMPIHSVEAALAWHQSNVDQFRTKTGRIGGNSGLKKGVVQKKETSTDTIIKNSLHEALTHVVPKLWFGQIGWLGGAMRDHGVKVSAAQLIKIQSMLFMIYMSEVDEYLQTESSFALPETLMARPGDQTYSSLVELLNTILAKEPKRIYES